jgi:hypothetical protein
MDYITSLQKKFSCARQKCESVFYVPWVLELKYNLKCVKFVTVSNHKNVKQLTILVPHFQVYDFETPVKNKSLTFVEISGENGRCDVYASDDNNW